jgi:hypothetical protein
MGGTFVTHDNKANCLQVFFFQEILQEDKKCETCVYDRVK